MQSEEIFRRVVKEDFKVKSSVPLHTCYIKEITLDRFSLSIYQGHSYISRLIRTCVPKQMPKKKKEIDKQIKGNKKKGNKLQLQKVQLQTKMMKCFP